MNGSEPRRTGFIELFEDHAEDEQNPIGGNPTEPAVAVGTCPENAAPTHEHVTDAQAESYNQKSNMHAEREDMVVDHSLGRTQSLVEFAENLTADPRQAGTGDAD
jgi:hypothetical protein